MELILAETCLRDAVALFTELENNRKGIMVVIAGYKDKMQKLFDLIRGCNGASATSST